MSSHYCQPNHQLASGTQNRTHSHLRNASACDKAICCACREAWLRGIADRDPSTGNRHKRVVNLKKQI